MTTNIHKLPSSCVELKCEITGCLHTVNLNNISGVIRHEKGCSVPTGGGSFLMIREPITEVVYGDVRLFTYDTFEIRKIDDNVRKAK